MSNDLTLCPPILSGLLIDIHSKKSLSTSLSILAPATVALLIPVISVIFVGIFLPGLAYS